MSKHEAIVIDTSTNQHRPVDAADQFDTNTEKLIAGAVVAGAISGDAGNQIVVGSDGKLKVPATTFISADAGNDIVLGSDQRPYLAETVTKLEYDGGTVLTYTAEDGGVTTHDLASMVTAFGAAAPQMDGAANAGLSVVASREDHVHPTDTTRAPLASPAFTGVPTAPTPIAGDNSTKLATTAFVTAVAAAINGALPGTTNPTMNGAVAQGVSGNFSREDHVHPTDTTRAPLASPAFTGTPTAPTPAAGDSSTKLATTAFVQSSAPSIIGAFRNLKASATGLNASVTVTADELILESAAPAYATVRNVNLTINSAGIGANGLDTGALAASTWYAVHVIYNQAAGTVAGLLSLSATAPTLPAGYTFAARVGYIRTDATANKFPKGFIQNGRGVRYKVAAASNVTGMPQIATGAQGNIVTPTWIAFAVAGFVPPTAAAIDIVVQNGLNTTIIAAPSNAYGAYNNAANLPPIVMSGASSAAAPARFVLESGNIYYAAGAGSAMVCLGWEDSL